MLRKLSVGMMLVLLVAGCAKPFSPLDKTEWLDVENGMRLEIGSNGTAELNNEISGKSSSLSYAQAAEEPNIYDFRSEDSSEAFLRLVLPSGNIEDKSIKLDGLTKGLGNYSFVHATSENEKAMGERVAFVKKQAQKEGIEDAPKDKAKYVDVKRTFGELWATYYLLSQNSKAADDEQKLGMLSEAWNGTADSFERNAMREKELALINTQISAIRKVEFVKLDYADPNDAYLAVALTSGEDGQYDFKRRAFPLTGGICGPNSTPVNANGIRLRIHKFPEEICFLPVSDEAIAKQIEHFRLANETFIKTLGYYKLGPILDGSKIGLLPVGADLEVVRHVYDGTTSDFSYSTTVWAK